MTQPRRATPASLVEGLHGRYVHRRRVRVLCAHLAETLPPNARALDVGCGDGLIARLIAERRPDVEVRGMDVLARAHAHIPVEAFDGRTIPCEDRAFDAVLFVDVLHHAEDPLALLREGVRSSRLAVVIKDHLCDGPLAKPVLRFMDRIGNARHGVTLPYNYWRRRQWQEAFAALDLSVVSWKERLGLYPPPASWIFERSLHFVARVDKR